MFTRIMLATDGSKLSQKAVKSAIDLASKFNAELVAVKVIPRYVQTYFEGSFTVADIDVKSIEAQWAAGAQVVLDKIATSATAKGVSVKTSVIKSDDISEEGATPFQNYFYVDEMSDSELRKMLSLFKLRFN